MRSMQLPARLAAGVTCVTAMLLGWAPARAQAIDQYLDAAIPGYNADPGVTVVSRLRPGYDPPGVHLGSFTISPVLSESAGYDSDVTASRPSRGSALIETNASVGAAAQYATSTIGASMMVDDFEYPEQSAQSLTDWTAAIGASHDFGRDTLTVAATHLNLNQTPRDLDVPGLDNTIAYRVEDARATYKVDLGHASILPGIELSYYGYDNGTIQGLPYLQTYRDRLVISPSIEASYEFATRRRVVLVFRDNKAAYSHIVAGVPKQDFNDVAALGGLAYDADGIIGFRLLAGYEGRTFSAGLYRTIQAPIVEGSVTWTPTGLTTITGTLTRHIEDAAAESTSGFTESAVKLSLDHEYQRNIILGIHAGYINDDYAKGVDSAGGSQDFYTAGASIQWLINRNLRLSGDYTFSSRQTDASRFGDGALPLPEDFFGGSYSENTVRLALRFAL